MILSYSIAAYFGNRNTGHKYLLEDKTYYVKKQIEHLKKCSIPISKIYIVCTFADDINQDEIFEIIKNIQILDNRIHIFIRDNLGGSYCSWQYSLWEDDGYSDYVFLVEDDYVIDDPNGISFLIENYIKPQPNLFYLCQLWSKTPYNTFGDNIPEHAAMSCGIINNKIYDEYRKEYEIDFKVWYEKGYQTMWRNQSCFLENYRQLGFKFSDWTDRCSSYFPQSDMEYGKSDGIKILKSLI